MKQSRALISGRCWKLTGENNGKSDGPILLIVTSHRDSELPSAPRKVDFGIVVLGVNSGEFGEEKGLIPADFSRADLSRFEVLMEALDRRACDFVQETKSYLRGYQCLGK